jgi:hypothetical protein
VEFVSSKDPAMVKAVETPSVVKSSGTLDTTMQRTEARSHQRNYIPVKRGKVCDTLKEPVLSDAGDSSREKGRTQKYLRGSLIPSKI